MATGVRKRSQTEGYIPSIRNEHNHKDPVKAQTLKQPQDSFYNMFRLQQVTIVTVCVHGTQRSMKCFGEDCQTSEHDLQ
ncbi:hypothetical protein DPMN_138027 [Dreissena polymorpha]|uniref:Uncharacterized protein n=1 Tax=Dreissena polymorpha TaxID=45954 RepID=A0A9D4G3R8_DREPO|nr:hypothetical protein DPMN_138027 [Dreissena polymorpha]